MKKNILSILIATMVFNLAGCDVTKDSLPDINNKNKIIKVASLPLLEELVLSLSPTFGGQRNDIIMQQVCAVAKMEKTQDQFEQFFINKGIDLGKLADKDPGFNLLADKDLKKKQVACMAYLVSSAFTRLEVERVIDKSKNSADSVQIDNVLLNKELSERLQVMNANAIFFSILSEKLERKPPVSMVKTKQEIINLATDFSSAYFQILSENPMDNQHFTLKGMHEGQLDFSSEGGYLYSQVNNLVTLKLDGFNWYGEDELLGKKYFVNVEYN